MKRDNHLLPVVLRDKLIRISLLGFCPTVCPPSEHHRGFIVLLLSAKGFLDIWIRVGNCPWGVLERCF